MFLARKLNPEGYGLLNATLALASLFAVFAINIGAHQVILREISIRPRTTLGIFKIVFPVRMISLVIAILALIFYEFYKGESNYVLIGASILIVTATLLWDLAESIAFGHLVTKITTIIGITASLVWLIIVVLLPNHGLDVNLVIFLYACLFVLRGGVYLVLSYLKFVKGNKEPAKINLKAVLMMSMPFLLMRVVSALGEHVPILLLKGFSGAAEVGYYAVGNRFVMPIIMAITTGMKAVFPFMSRLYKENIDEFNIKSVQGFTFIFAFGSITAATLTITSHIWLPLLFGDEYRQAARAFNYQAWIGVLLSFDLLLATMLTSSYRQNMLAFITIIDVLILLPFLYVGSNYGADGMAIAKLFGAILVFIFHVFFIIVKMQLNLRTKEFVSSVIFFIILMITSIFINDFLIKFSVLIVSLTIYLMVIKSYFIDVFKAIIKISTK